MRSCSYTHRLFICHSAALMVSTKRGPLYTTCGFTDRHVTNAVIDHSHRRRVAGALIDIVGMLVEEGRALANSVARRGCSATRRGLASNHSVASSVRHRLLGADGRLSISRLVRWGLHVTWLRDERRLRVGLRHGLRHGRRVRH
jgi:hypothetical protein